MIPSPRSRLAARGRTGCALPLPSSGRAMLLARPQAQAPQPASLSADLDLRQLSGRPPRRRPARRRRRRRLLPRGAARRSRETTNCSTAPSWRCSPNGDVDEAVRLAERVLQVDKNDRIARLVLGVRAIKQKQYPAARRELAQSVRGPITDLAATLLSAWTMVGPSEAKARDRDDRQARRRRLVRAVQGSACRPDPRSSPASGKTPPSGWSAPTSSIRPRCAWCRPMAAGCRARAARTRRSRSIEAFDEALPRHPLVAGGDRRGQGRQEARRCWSTRRRPAPPRCSTASAPRSDAAAARISASSICSSRSISRRTIRSRCSRSPISTRR